MSLSKYSNSFSSDKIFRKKLLFNILQKLQNKEQGFTLIELLVAMAILTIVVGITGTGLLFIISTNTKSDIQITQQANLRRTADFISDEVKAASVVALVSTATATTDPTWKLNLNPQPTYTSTGTALYLEIPTTATTSATTITINNHGLAPGNAVKFSGTNVASVSTPSIDTTTTYYVTSDTTKITTNTFEVIKADGTSISFTATAQNFAIRRLVMYYAALSNTANWKGFTSLYRSTGNCPATATTPENNTSKFINCLVVVDSLFALPANPSATLSPFFPSLTTDNKQVTLSLNGRLCTPATMENNCSSPATTSQTIQAVSRATLR
jgi:prepilin-type N-terminal cleavage/methylation domain-containing protein